MALRPPGRNNPLNSAQTPWQGAGIKVLPIGFLMGPRSAGPWAAARWPGMLPGNRAGLSSEPGLVFGRKPAWISAFMMWAIASKRSRMSPVDEAVPSSRPSLSKDQIAQIDRRAFDDSRAKLSFWVGRWPAPPITTLPQIALPHRSSEAVPVSQSRLDLHRFVGQEKFIREAPAPGPAAITALQGSEPQVQPSLRRPGGAREPHLPAAKRPEFESGFERRKESGATSVTRDWTDRRKTWIPLAFNLAAKFEQNGSMPATSPRLSLIQVDQGRMKSDGAAVPDLQSPPERLWPAAGQQVAVLIEEIIQMVKKRDLPGRESQAPPAQPVASPTPGLDPAQVLLLAEREYQERAFRMGR